MNTVYIILTIIFVLVILFKLAELYIRDYINIEDKCPLCGIEMDNDSPQRVFNVEGKTYVCCLHHTPFEIKQFLKYEYLKREVKNGNKT